MRVVKFPGCLKQDHSAILPCLLEAGLLSSEAADMSSNVVLGGIKVFSWGLLYSNYDHMKDLFSLIGFFFKVRGKSFFDEILIEEN